MAGCGDCRWRAGAAAACLRRRPVRGCVEPAAIGHFAASSTLAKKNLGMMHRTFKRTVAAGLFAAAALGSAHAAAFTEDFGAPFPA
jgi:hypothetical protein